MELHSIGAVALFLSIISSFGQTFSREKENISGENSTNVFSLVDEDLGKVSPLLKAAQNGEVKRVKRLLKAGEDISVKTANNITALWIASALARPRMVEILLEAGADTEIAGPGGMTPLLAASQGGAEGIVVQLLESGAKIEAEDSTGATPLIVASIFGQGKVLEILIDSEAELEARRGESLVTALWAASYQGKLSCVVELIAAGSQIDAKDMSGATSLFVASQEGHQLVARALLQAGANPIAMRNDGATPLHAAAAKCRRGVVELLLENGGNPVLQDSHGYLPVDLLNRTNCQNGREFSSVEAILRPLFHAAREGQDWQVQLLIDSGQSVNATLRSNGMTPLHVAAAHGRQEVIQVLLEAGADVNVEDKLGRTALDVIGKDRKLNPAFRANISQTLTNGEAPARSSPSPQSSGEQYQRSAVGVRETRERRGDSTVFLTPSGDDGDDKSLDLTLTLMVLIGALFGVSVACAATAFFKYKQTQEAVRLTGITSPNRDRLPGPMPTSCRTEPADVYRSSFSDSEAENSLPPLRSERRATTSRREVIHYHSESSVIRNLKPKHSTLECASDVNCDDD